MLGQQITDYLKKHDFRAFDPKVVLFDMDGTLYDSMPNHRIAWQQSMAEWGITMTDDDVYSYEGMRGFDIEKLIARKYTGQDISDQMARTRYEEKSRIFETLPRAEIMQGAKELMTKLRADGLLIGIVTGSSQRPLLQRLANDFANWVCPDHIVSAFNVKRGKPYADPYLEGLHVTGDFNPWQAIVVENAPLGVQAGAAARIFTIAVNSGPLPDEVLRNSGADIVLPSIQSLADIWPIENRAVTRA